MLHFSPNERLRAKLSSSYNSPVMFKKIFTFKSIQNQKYLLISYKYARFSIVIIMLYNFTRFKRRTKRSGDQELTSVSFWVRKKFSPKGYVLALWILYSHEKIPERVINLAVSVKTGG